MEAKNQSTFPMINNYYTVVFINNEEIRHFQGSKHIKLKTGT